jgi:hypothetical protein
MTTTEPDRLSGYSHYCEPWEHLSGQFILFGTAESARQWNCPRQLVTGVGSCEYTTGTLAYIGIKKGDNYADIVLNEDELRDLVGSLTHTLDLMA